MTVADYLVRCLIEKNVTDVFGIPGGVVLDFLYALDRNVGITPHLSYHEQMSAFEASGYAQVNGNLGVVYATKGPGILNTITAVADAYSESIPLLIITSHSIKKNSDNLRFIGEQELDTVNIFKSITKYAVSVDKLEDVKQEIRKSIWYALDGRKGPVLIDILSDLFNKEIIDNEKQTYIQNENVISINDVKKAKKIIADSSRPIILVGDGVRQSGNVKLFNDFASQFYIPIVSSRAAQDIILGKDYNFGYIGSHGTRYSNFIMAKADLIICVGNRLGFPFESKSFSPILEKKIIRIDIDDTEINRYTKNSINLCVDFSTIINDLVDKKNKSNWKDWYDICHAVKSRLKEYDLNYATNIIAKSLVNISNDWVVVCDVGNNEFWVSRTYEYLEKNNRILYSKSFGTLGCGLGKAIGAYYRTKKPVVVFIGDQGIQLNIQELQFISKEKLPIYIIILNNNTSGMIRSRQKTKYNAKYLHTTLNSGYSAPDFKKIAMAYNINYYCIKQEENIYFANSGPIIYDILIDEDIDLEPSLRYGDECQNMYPYLEPDLYNELNNI